MLGLLRSGDKGWGIDEGVEKVFKEIEDDK